MPTQSWRLAPRFELRSYDDMSVASDELLTTGPLVLTFYRGLWCPNCQKDLRSFIQLIDEASELDKCVLAISRPREPGCDRPRDHELELNFPDQPHAGALYYQSRSKDCVRRDRVQL